MARDNECEVVKGLIATNPRVALFVASAALKSSDPDARWQAAIAVAEAAELDAIPLLREYTKDAHEYVRRRAHLAIRALDPIFAEQQAVSWLDSKHEYIRMVALDTLAATASKHLATALERLRGDFSAVVLQRVKELKPGRPDV